jgi:hypothetical protein
MGDEAGDPAGEKLEIPQTRFISLATPFLVLSVSPFMYLDL